MYVCKFSILCVSKRNTQWSSRRRNIFSYDSIKQLTVIVPTVRFVFRSTGQVHWHNFILDLVGLKPKSELYCELKCIPFKKYYSVSLTFYDQIKSLRLRKGLFASWTEIFSASSAEILRFLPFLNRRFLHFCFPRRFPFWKELFSS